MLPYLCGEVKESPREFFFYISDDGDIMAIRMGDWKVAPSDIMAWIAAEDEKHGPYQPCSCGSGKKFRFCHGKRGS